PGALRLREPQQLPGALAEIVVLLGRTHRRRLPHGLRLLPQLLKPGSESGDAPPLLAGLLKQSGHPPVDLLGPVTTAPDNSEGMRRRTHFEPLTQRPAV